MRTRCRSWQRSAAQSHSTSIPLSSARTFGAFSPIICNHHSRGRFESRGRWLTCQWAPRTTPVVSAMRSLACSVPSGDSGMRILLAMLTSIPEALPNSPSIFANCGSCLAVSERTTPTSSAKAQWCTYPVRWSVIDLSSTSITAAKEHGRGGGGQPCLMPEFMPDTGHNSPLPTNIS